MESLECFGNRLTSLDISKNSALEELRCFSNQLTSLDLSKNSALAWIECNNNRLTSLDVSRNAALQCLVFNFNPGDGISRFPLKVWFTPTEYPSYLLTHGKWAWNGNVITPEYTYMTK
jgi:Leucine-rich repeat (LRR) protein